METEVQGHLLSPNGLAVPGGSLRGGGQPGDDGAGHRRRGAPVVALQAVGGGVDQLPLGVDVARLDVDGHYALRAELDGQDAGHAVEGPLGGGVAEPPPAMPDRAGGIGEGDGGGDVDDGAATGGQHGGEHRLGDDDLGHHVGVQPGPELVDGEVHERHHAARSGGDGVVDQYVDAAPLVEGGGHGVTERLVVEEVGDQWEGADAAGLDGLGGLVEAARHRPVVADVGVVPAVTGVEGAGGDGDVQAGFREGDGRRLADAPTGSGDERRPPGVPVAG